jgi:hypothetical protein
MTAINLLPRHKEASSRGFYVIFFVVINIVFLLWHISLQQRKNVAIKQVHMLQKDLESVAKQSQDSAQLKKQEQIMANNIKELEQSRIKFVQIFRVMHQGMARNLNLIQLAIKSREIKIIGRTKSISDLKQLVVKIIDSKCGNFPVIQKVNRNQNGYDFVLLW